MKASRASSRPSCRVAVCCIVLAGCASYSGWGLKPGQASLTEVVATMGNPAMSWRDPDGGEQLAYPRGPAGTQTFMVFIAPDGRLQRIEAVLDIEHFALIGPGKADRAAVLRLIGPPVPQWTSYFPTRNELVWEWQFCDSWNQLARFDVLFDATTGIVRTSYQRPALMGANGVAPWCGR
ncbi:hypothetical protein [Accumulibacter sp.]|uniref:hypothetical protein n=1 Tax=Accumulibacter sp. TaxID=2053492 RepID=UPI0025FF2B1F|nr:hypothetical protein [Accumulibacter sp.]MCM8594150.1 hypothetical protein [Accumulibacter sp.]MDS4048293.1 hypothetical protein [Accumulibacter sp.]